MRTGLLIFAVIALAAAPARADWQAVERVEPYAISGQSGIALYRSIGENGPKVGIGRVVAYTTFDLKWSRDYREEAGACRLAAARPHLIFIYKLPKPSGPLPAATKRSWDTFIDGIAAHERVHGEIIVDMVKKIEAFSVGLAVANDPGCRKVRQVLKKRLVQLSQEQRARSREFDRVEMSEGGNVHRLILGLVNGG
ncbi:DUF922 domain-containing Zn-dependent protease [Mesorhizobium xinjiangense]|uniref:DUF922 domain-containing Zn-dependent protease n=1 Tax=Mesorhizobium xinjiangense TaxID=2678685 RepID=UPI0012EE7CCD|nr:DUF922 domain-containing protein [Mesorhizobium xinjiangense]